MHYEMYHLKNKSTTEEEHYTAMPQILRYVLILEMVECEKTCMYRWVKEGSLRHAECEVPWDLRE